VRINSVAIIGGTHGNEYTGVYLLKRMKINKIHEKWEKLNIELILGNPKAYEKCVRFIDYDLNRSFLIKDLNNFDLSGYEADRAKVINHKLGPKEASETDFIIDIHSTTANMGVSIILHGDNQYNFKVASYIKEHLKNVFIYYVPEDSNADYPFLNSISPYGLTLEVGPIANGIVRHDILEKAEIALYKTIEFMYLMESKQMLELPRQLEVFEHVKTVDFPRNSQGEISAIIHKNLQDCDYPPLEKGMPIFYTLEGNTINFDENETMYPIFINEAAYYDKNIAFSLTKKVLRNIY
jgi:aspartoacylase